MGLPELNLYAYYIETGLDTQPPSPEIDNWPGAQVTFVCRANKGRSVMAMECFRHKFPRTHTTSGGIVDYSNQPLEKPPRVVVDVLEENGFHDGQYHIPQTLRPDMIPTGTDVFVFCDTRLLPSWVVQQARSVIAIPILDPSAFAYDERTLKKHVADCFIAIRHLVYTALKPMIFKVQSGQLEDRKEADGIYHPHYNIQYRVPITLFTSQQTKQGA